MSGEGAEGAGRPGRGGDLGTHRQLSAERGLPMARGPGSTESPGGVTLSHRRPRGDEPKGRRPRMVGVREPSDDADAARRVPWNVVLAARADPLCTAAGAGGRWLLRSRSRRDGNGSAGWVGRWGGRGRAGAGGAVPVARGGSVGRAGGRSPHPRLGAGAGSPPGAGAGRPGAGRRARLGLGVWLRGGVWGPAGGRGRLVWAPPTTLACLLQRPWGGMTQGWGAPGTVGLMGSCGLESRKTIFSRGAGSAYTSGPLACFCVAYCVLRPHLRPLEAAANSGVLWIPKQGVPCALLEPGSSTFLGSQACWFRVSESPKRPLEEGMPPVTPFTINLAPVLPTSSPLA